ncbi:hypothetical protein [Pseudobythopirellula maris]|uniref:hypothetical protein n=1 Tax=Pseudobythopirellula maris TaxID=2527991 RepID=UPI0011B85051|nr:hypothetical protein [Pseudobythopirellula maris]
MSVYKQPGPTQPVELRLPSGAAASDMAPGGGFSSPHAERLLVGLTIGPVYRFKVSGVPNYPDVEVYPSVELIDHLSPPPGKELEFPVPVELTSEELQMAARGAFVTRVIYVEDPTTALPVEQSEEQAWFEARPGDDPLVLADQLGRPIAILRIGSRAPVGANPAFGFHAPPVQHYSRSASGESETPYESYYGYPASEGPVVDSDDFDTSYQGLPPAPEPAEPAPVWTY